MKIVAKNGSDLRPKDGDFVTSTLLELTPNQSLGRIPANVVFLIDASSSMGGAKWNMAKGAAKELVEALKDDDRVALVLFHSSSKEIFELASLSQNRRTMLEMIEKMPTPSGVTNLEEGLKTAFQVFEKRSQADKEKRVNHVILLTDGFPTDKQGYRVDETGVYEKLVQKHEHITLTGVGIGSADEYDSSFINRLSELGRGSYYHAGDLEKFKEGLRAEIEKLQSSVVGELILKFSNISGRMMRIAKVAPEIVVYDIPGNTKNFELSTGSMTKDLTSFMVQTRSTGTGQAGIELPLYDVQAIYDNKNTENVSVKVKTTADALALELDPDVLRTIQVLQVHLNGEQIKASLKSGDKEKATRLIENTTKIASGLGQDKVTKALTRLSDDLRKGRSGSDNLATLQDESKKTKLLIS